MSNNYVKKYECGELRMDLPRANCIYELPLLSFGDMRNSVNLSLIFNRAVKVDGGNPFNISNGYKLNLQKRIIKNSDNSISYQEADGKIVDLLGENNIVVVHTFLDHSQRIVREISSGYELEYPDFSKERYDSNGRIINTIDKYGDKILTYEYANNVLVAITYRENTNVGESKVITFDYDCNCKISRITYSGNSSDDIALTYASSLVHVDHYSGVKYDLRSYNKDFTAKISDAEETFTYHKKCILDPDDECTYILTDWVGDEEVNRTKYKYPDLINSPKVSFAHVDITDNFGVRTRAQFNTFGITCSYEIGENGVEFLNEKYAGNVDVYQTAEDMYNFRSHYVQKYKDGIPLQLESDGVFRHNPIDFGNKKGFFTVSGWIKAKENTMDTNLGVTVSDTNVQLAPIMPEPNHSFTINCISKNDWRYFAFKLYDISRWERVNLIVTDTMLVKDIRVSFQSTHTYSQSEAKYIPFYEDVLIHKTEGTAIPLKDVFFSALGYKSGDGLEEKYGFDWEYDYNSFNDLLRYIVNKKRNVNTTEFYYSGCETVVGINPSDNITFGYRSESDASTYSLDNYYLGRINYSNGEILKTIVKHDKNNYFLRFETCDESGNIISIQQFNSYMDVIATTNEGVKTSYTRDKGLVTFARVVGCYNTSTVYDENDGIITYTDEFAKQTKYTMNKTWGTIEKIELPDGSVITDTYDADKSVLMGRSFGDNSETRTHTFSYAGGNLVSLSDLLNDGINYGFSYTNGDLTGVSKASSNVSEHRYTTTNTTDHYPQKDGAMYSISRSYDKYGRLLSIDKVLNSDDEDEPQTENKFSAVYDVYPEFDDDTGALVPNADNAASHLAMTTDSTVGEVSRYKYTDEGELVAKAVTSVIDFTDKISTETFEYDRINRLTEHSYTYDPTGKIIKDQIFYIKSDSDPLADGLVDNYTNYIGNDDLMFTANTYDEYNRISVKEVVVKDHDTFEKSVNYDKTRIRNLADTMSDTNLGTNEYVYDVLGRIESDTYTSATSNSYKSYEYDHYGQLIRENNQALDKTFIYEYNSNGNVTSVKTYDYTTAAELTGTYTEQTYSYDSTHKDRFVGFGSTNISYNAIGCPTTYQGKSLTWTDGKLLRMTSGSRTEGLRSYSYAYNALGQRVSSSYSFMTGTDVITPVLDGEVTAYTKSYNYDHFGRLLYETNTKTIHGEGTVSSEIVYLYDESSMIGMLYTTLGVTKFCYFQRNLQGDVVGIYDENGTLKVKYNYDAWGNCTISSETTDYPLAHANPIRYRGYYYDEDTGLYYLNARYYSPVWRRFISPDSTAYIDPESVNGLNLYAYCNNDPVNYYDPSGHSITLALIFAGTFAVGFGSSLFINAATNNWELDWKDFAQAGVDGLFAVAGTALAMTGICAGLSIGLGAAMGWSQYAIGTKIQGGNLTWCGSFTAIAFGALGGKISGPGATNVQNVADNLIGLSDDGLRAAKAIATAMNRRMAGQISKRGFQGVINLYGKTAFSAIDAAIPGTSRMLFMGAAKKLAIYTPFANMASGGLGYLYNAWGWI